MRRGVHAVRRGRCGMDRGTVIVPRQRRAAILSGLRFTDISGRTDGSRAVPCFRLILNIRLGDAVTNNGTITVNSDHTLEVSGMITNTGTFNNTSTGRTVASGGFTGRAGSVFMNSGVFTGSVLGQGRAEAESKTAVLYVLGSIFRVYGFGADRQRVQSGKTVYTG